VRQYPTSLFLSAVLAAGVAFAQDVIGPAPITMSSQRPTASMNGYIVVFTPGTGPNIRANAVVAAGAGLRHNYVGTDAAAVTVPNTNALEALRRSAGVVSVVPDFIIHSQAKGGKGGPPPTTVTFDTRKRFLLEYSESAPLHRFGWRRNRDCRPGQRH
jgi:lipoprotein-anchoring transpeptidase ErfK/SrfK